LLPSTSGVGNIFHCGTECHCCRQTVGRGASQEMCVVQKRLSTSLAHSDLTHCCLYISCWSWQWRQQAILRPTVDAKFDFQSKYVFYEFCLSVHVQ
jgi:hypothetical protein